MMKRHLKLLLVAAAGCSSTLDSTTTTTIDVREPNTLGVTTLQVTQVDHDGNLELTIEGLAAGARQLASIQLTAGHLSDVAAALPGHGDQAAELRISVAGSEDSRIATRATGRFVVQPPPGTAPFLDLTEVSATLARFHVFVMDTAGPTTEVTYLNGPPVLHLYFSEKPAPAGDFTMPCPTDDPTCVAPVLKPVAGQACQNTNTSSDAPTIVTAIFVPPTSSLAGNVIERFAGPACTLSISTDSATCPAPGTGPSDCYYGPGGFSVPTAYAPPAGEYAFITTASEDFSNKYTVSTGTTCTYSFVTSPPTPVFATVTGSSTNGCSCCGNGTGVCCGTAACDACSPSQSEAEVAEDIGRWDQ
jgi:hypothetical protein